MPKVIFVTALTLWSMGKGHGGPAFTQTVKKYMDEGWEVYLISDEPSNRDYPALDAAHNIFLDPTIYKKYRSLRKVGLLFRWLDHRLMTRRFSREIWRVMGGDAKNTVLYAYEIFGIRAAQRLSQKTGAPLIARFQGVSNIRPFLFGPISHIRKYPYHQALKTPSDLVIMTDDGSSGARILQELGNQSPTLFLRNGVELMERDLPAMKAAFDRTGFRASLGVAENEIMFLTVSRLVLVKHVERAIDGFAAYQKKHLTGKLVIVGDGDEREALMRRAIALGIPDQVIFTGAVPHESVYNYMMACDIFLSLYDKANLGNPLLEAMALGKPIITLDEGDTRSVVHDGENAVLLSRETLPTLGPVMAELAADGALRERLGKGAADYARANFYGWTKRMDIEFEAVSKLLRP